MENFLWLKKSNGLWPGPGSASEWNGSQTKHISSLSCRGRFNNETCECECDEQIYKNKILR